MKKKPENQQIHMIGEKKSENSAWIWERTNVEQEISLQKT